MTCEQHVSGVDRTLMSCASQEKNTQVRCTTDDVDALVKLEVRMSGPQVRMSTTADVCDRIPYERAASLLRSVCNKPQQAALPRAITDSTTCRQSHRLPREGTSLRSLSHRQTHCTKRRLERTEIEFAQKLVRKIMGRRFKGKEEVPERTGSNHSANCTEERHAQTHKRVGTVQRLNRRGKP